MQGTYVTRRNIKNVRNTRHKLLEICIVLEDALFPFIVQVPNTKSRLKSRQSDSQIQVDEEEIKVKDNEPLQHGSQDRSRSSLSMCSSAIYNAFAGSMPGSGMSSCALSTKVHRPSCVSYRSSLLVTPENNRESTLTRRLTI